MYCSCGNPPAMLAMLLSCPTRMMLSEKTSLKQACLQQLQVCHKRKGLARCMLPRCLEMHLLRSRFQLSQELRLHPLLKRIQHRPVLPLLCCKWSQHAHGSIKVVHLQSSSTVFHAPAECRGQQCDGSAAAGLRAHKVGRSDQRRQ